MGLRQVNFSVKANGNDITQAIKGRLLFLQITDSQGESSDTVDIEIDNRDQKVALPKTGASLDVSIGYDNNLVFKGTFEVDELEEPLEIDTLRIHGKAAKIKQSFKAPKDASFDDITLGNLVKQIAGHHNFEPVINSNLASVMFEHIDQVAESDMNLLSRLVKDHGGIVKPVANKLLVLTKDEAKTASGKSISKIIINSPADSKGKVTITERSNYNTVKAYWFDEALQERQEVLAGNGEPVFVIRTRYKDQERAQAKADAKLRALQRGKKELNITRPLIPEMVAEGPVSISNHKASANGDWIVEEVVHTIGAHQLSTSSAILHLPK